MGWYIVIKTIKGHRYRYRQRTWREGKHVRTQSIYLGPVDGGRGDGRTATPFAQAEREIGSLGGYAHIDAMPLEQRNAYGASQLAQSLGLNKSFLYQKATERGIDLNAELEAFDAWRANGGNVLEFSNGLMGKVTSPWGEGREVGDQAERSRMQRLQALENELRVMYELAGKGLMVGEQLPAKPSADDIPFDSEEKPYPERLAAWEREVYAMLGQSKIAKAFEQVRVALELSEPGYRYIPEDAHQHGGSGVLGVSSTFPNWVPEQLRRKKLFDRLLPFVDPENVSYPTRKNASRQRELYQLILDRVDHFAGVDTSAIREKIMREYEQSQPHDSGVENRDGASAGGARAEASEAPRAVGRGQSATADAAAVVRQPDIPALAPRTVEEAIHFVTPFTAQLKGQDRIDYERDRQQKITDNEEVRYGSYRQRIKRQQAIMRAVKRKTRGIKAINAFLAQGIKKKPKR